MTSFALDFANLKSKLRYISLKNDVTGMLTMSPETLKQKFFSPSSDMFSSFVSCKDGSAVVLPDGFKLLGRLGTGSTGSVFLVEKDGKKYALKLLREEGNNEEEILSKVQGDNVIRLAKKGFSCGNGKKCILMEVAEGKTLEEMISDGRLTQNEKLLILKETASALASVHGKGVLHLDVKPSNVVVDNLFHVTLGDFSIAREIGQRGFCVTGKIAGSAPYMAPEAFDENGILDARTDVFSLGVLAYELFTGVKPFHGDTVEEIRCEILHGKPVRPRKLVSNVLRGVEVMLEKMLAKNPAERYDDAGGIVRDADAILKDENSVIERKKPFLQKLFPFIQIWS